MRALLFAALAATAAAISPAKADAIGEMSCLDVRQVMDDFQNRKAEAFRIWHWVGVRFLVDDDAWTDQGHESVVKKWSPKGEMDSEAFVTGSCGEYRQDTLAERTDDAFKGFAELYGVFGGAK